MTAAGSPLVAVVQRGQTMPSEQVNVRATRAFMREGKLIGCGQVVAVSRHDAQELIHMGKAELYVAPAVEAPAEVSADSPKRGPGRPPKPKEES